MTFEDRAAFYRSRAAVALAHQHWGEAVEQLQALVAISPNDATAWNNLGVALEHQHKNKEAVEAYGRAAAERYFYKGGAAAADIAQRRYLGHLVAEGGALKAFDVFHDMDTVFGGLDITAGFLWGDNSPMQAC
jgi:tetratricopeptide (TPR) repeat protein